MTGKITISKSGRSLESPVVNVLLAGHLKRMMEQKQLTLLAIMVGLNLNEEVAVELIELPFFAWFHIGLVSVIGSFFGILYVWDRWFRHYEDESLDKWIRK